MMLEACCGNVSHALAAAAEGVDRIELNSALALGGLTPSLGLFREVRRAVSIPVLPMLRPREGGFCYDHAETACMLKDAEAFLADGADGLVFGFLTPDGEIDADRVRSFVKLADGRQTVFHRAIDLVRDWRRALSILIDLGVTRVLTSGQAVSAWDGRETLREMHAFAQGALEIQPAGGIHPGNCLALLHATGCTMLHLSGSRYVRDRSWPEATNLWFAASGAPDGGSYPDADRQIFRAMREALQDEKQRTNFPDNSF